MRADAHHRADQNSSKSLEPVWRASECRNRALPAGRIHARREPNLWMTRRSEKLMRDRTFGSILSPLRRHQARNWRQHRAYRTGRAGGRRRGGFRGRRLLENTGQKAVPKRAGGVAERARLTRMIPSLRSTQGGGTESCDWANYLVADVRRFEAEKGLKVELQFRKAGRGSGINPAT